MRVEKGLLYTKDHDWVKVEGNVATVGLADYAQDHLGDIVYVELPEVDDEVEAGDSLASVESVKAASDINAPVSGKIIEVNELLDDEPGEINKDCYAAWVCISVYFPDVSFTKICIKLKPSVEIIIKIIPSLKFLFLEFSAIKPPY